MTEKNMADDSQKPILKKPPGYVDPNAETKPLPVPSARKRVVPSAFHLRRKRHRSCCSCRCCCCCFLVTLLILLLLIVLASLAFHIWFDPKLPVFRVGSFQVKRFSVKKTRETDRLTARTAARLEVRNPNGKLTYHYGPIDAEVFVGKEDDEISVGRARFREFKQGPRNATFLRLRTGVKNKEVFDSTAKRLSTMLKSKKLLVKIKAQTKVGFSAGGLRMGMLGVKLKCGGVSLKRFTAESPRCTINILRWINIR